MKSWKGVKLLVGAAFLALLLVLAVGTSASAATPSPSPTATPTPTPTPTPQQSGGFQLPGVPDPFEFQARLLFYVIDETFYSIDKAILVNTVEKLFNPMVSGYDNIDGRGSFGSALVFDATHLHDLWAFMRNLSWSLVGLIFVISLGIAMFQAGRVGVQAVIGGLLVRLTIAVVGIFFSYEIVNWLLQFDNVLIQAITSKVTVELRDLPAYQGLNLKEPGLLEEIGNLADDFMMLFVIAGLAFEMVLLIPFYVVRDAVILFLVLVAPLAFAVSIIPGKRTENVWKLWLRILIPTILVKFVNIIVFAGFLLIGATSKFSLINAFVLVAMPFLMMVIPIYIMRLFFSFDEMVFVNVHHNLRERVQTEAVGRATSSVKQAGAGLASRAARTIRSVR